MSRKCPITGKKPVAGRTYTTRGIAKKKKGIGLKITGKSPRQFIPNMQRISLFDSTTGRVKRLRISAKAIRLVKKLGTQKILSLYSK